MTKIEKYLDENADILKNWFIGGEQGRVDLKILPYLKHIENGFFVEAGALDGLFMSNTKLLEDLGWTGILIEPSKRAVDKCVRNRKSQVAPCALVSKDYGDDVVYGDFFFDGESGMGAWSGIHKNFYGLKAVASAPARTLDSILKDINVSKVDFLSLDVEGYELEALRGVDFSTTEISFILVEVNLNDYTLKQMDDYLGQFGYRNLGCLSGFPEDLEGWDGSHNDYMYGK